MVGKQGIEPRYTRYERVILPLNYMPFSLPATFLMKLLKFSDENLLPTSSIETPIIRISVTS